ncbi:MAG: hypothetical protein ACJ8C4_06730 [Gemmataceae bacterium]
MNLDEIIPVKAFEAHVVIVGDEHFESLLDFLRSRGLTATFTKNVKPEDGPLHEIIVSKETALDDFVSLVNEWKDGWMESSCMKRG